MQALILAGGEGTRLRPLTSTVPKPVVPLVERPFIAYLLDWLRGHGVDDVVISCGFMASGVRNVLGDGGRFGIRLRYVDEPEPLGTGGAVKFAESLLDERFLVLNGDVLCDFDLGAQVAEHERNGARATLALIRVEDPTGYGLVSLGAAGAVREFLEKPGPDQIEGGNLINGGVYVLERDVLGLMTPGVSASIEREVFPALVGDGLYGFRAEGYWLDIGTPARYLRATFDILEGSVRTAVADRLHDYLAVADGTHVDGRIVPPALVAEGCRVGEDARIGSRAVLGRDVSIGAGTLVERAVVLGGAEVGEHCTLSACVVGPGARVGDHTRILGGVVLGEGVTVGAHNELSAGARIFPGVTIPDEAIRF